MPSAYTCLITESETPPTFEAFALRCARRFGALTFMREEPLDAPIPEKLPEPDYAAIDADIGKATDALAALVQMTPNDAALAIEAEAVRVEALNGEINRERAARRARLVAMLREVNAWNPSQKLDGLRHFMRKQIEDELALCRFEAFRPRTWGVSEWLNARIAEARVDIFNATARRARAEGEAIRDQAWVDELRASLRAHGGRPASPTNEE